MENVLRLQSDGTDARAASHGGTVTRVDGPDGWCEFIEYMLYPGVLLQFNDVHIQTINESSEAGELLELNYCADGLYECEFKRGGYARVAGGIFAACGMDRAKSLSRFPTGFYKGVSVVIDAKRAQKYMDAAHPELMIDISDLPGRMCPAGTCFVARAEGALRQLFDQIMNPPECVRGAYYRVKLLELLMLLTMWQPGGAVGGTYLARDRVEQLRLVRDHLTMELDREITLEELSRTHGMCETQLKRDFKRVYGISPAAYRRAYRMEQAARILRDTDKSVTEVAMQVGYLNPSKFSHAFRAEMGVPPAEYRKSGDCLERQARNETVWSGQNAPGAL